MATLLSDALPWPGYLRADTVAAKRSSSTTRAAPASSDGPILTLTDGLRAAFLNQSLSGRCREK